MEKSKIAVKLCFIASLWLVLQVPAIAQVYQIKPLATASKTSIRGMSVVSDQVVWLSGSNGTIGRTLDGGTTWEWIKPAGYEKLDFRDIEAFDGNKAVVVNAGSPAYILRTTDGGKSWTEHYKNLDSAIFLDGMDFWDVNRGIVFGDPIDNKMQLLVTKDGGLNWRDASGSLKKELLVGEAGFAASGTTIRTYGKGLVWIATGGSVSNIYFSDNYGESWQSYSCPIIQGESSTGPFSMAFYDKKNGIVVGGNYLKDQENANNVLITSNGGKSWKKPLVPVSGYRSGVIYLNKKELVATGSSGTDVSYDGGMNWQNISALGFNVVQKSKTGNLVLLAGSKGEIFQLIK
jgi:photosystem II stability/assembly factor-like uncharacterized protein